jgi:hypothetical protein
VLDSHFGEEIQGKDINTNFAVYNETEIMVFSIDNKSDETKFFFKDSFSKLSSCNSVIKICDMYLKWADEELMAAVLMQNHDIVLLD